MQIGSTEWVEENRDMLASKAIAYLNVDSAVYAPGFWASATPQLDELVKQATQQVLQKSIATYSNTNFFTHLSHSKFEFEGQRSR